MSTTCIVGGDIYTPLETIPRGAILIEDNLIEAIGPADEIIPPEGSHIVDARGHLVLPGLVDLHLHGLAGKEVTDSDADSIPQMLARWGVTSFQASIAAGPLDQMVRDIGSASRLKGLPVSRCVGIHLEGPYLSPLQPGALNPGHFRPPNVKELESLVQAGAGQVRMVTLAPELPGSLDVIRWLTGEGIISAMGHTDASYEDVTMAVEAGLSHATHCFNAMKAFHHRDPGAVGAILTDNSITAEVIGDGVHVHPAAVLLLVRAKGAGKTCLVSDAAPVAGLGAGTYKWLGQELSVDGEAARLPDGTLAGSTRLLAEQLSFLEKSLPVPFHQIVEMATHTPSVVLGLESGLLAVGRRADIAIFDSQHRCRLTMIEGEIAYSA